MSASPTPPAPPRTTRHVQPLGPRVLVRLLRGEDRSEAGLFLPQGVKDAHSAALLALVVEVARTFPHTPVVAPAGDEHDAPAAPDLGSNVSGIPLGAHVLIPKDKGVPLPWDEDLRLIEVRHVLAMVELVHEDELQ